jgi:hypothetical protein
MPLFLSPLSNYKYMQRGELVCILVVAGVRGSGGMGDWHCGLWRWDTAVGNFSLFIKLNASC